MHSFQMREDITIGEYAKLMNTPAGSTSKIDHAQNVLMNKVARSVVAEIKYNPRKITDDEIVDKQIHAIEKKFLKKTRKARRNPTSNDLFILSEKELAEEQFALRRISTQNVLVDSVQFENIVWNIKLKSHIFNFQEIKYEMQMHRDDIHDYEQQIELHTLLEEVDDTGYSKWYIERLHGRIEESFNHILKCLDKLKPVGDLIVGIPN